MVCFLCWFPFLSVYVYFALAFSCYFVFVLVTPFWFSGFAGLLFVSTYSCLPCVSAFGSTSNFPLECHTYSLWPTNHCYCRPSHWLCATCDNFTGPARGMSELNRRKIKKKIEKTKQNKTKQKNPNIFYILRKKGCGVGQIKFCLGPPKGFGRTVSGKVATYTQSTTLVLQQMQGLSSVGHRMNHHCVTSFSER